MGGLPLVDHGIERLEAITAHIAVNAHHLAEQLVGHVDGRAHLSVEERLLGTAGALGRLRGWIGGRHVAVTNCDAWLWPNPLPTMARDWSGRTVRLSVVRASPSDFEGGLRYSGCCLLPGPVVAELPDQPAGLFEAVWGPRLGSPDLELVEHPGRFFDCGTPEELRAAQAAASAGLERREPTANR